MPTENWYPISGATHDLPAGKDGFTNSGGANKNASTRVGGGRSGPATHDDDTSYIDSIAGDLQQGLNIDWPSPMAQIDTATAFHVNMRTRVSGSTERLLYMMNSAGTLGTAAIDVTDSVGTYADHGPVDISNAATYRPGGGSWVLADFANEQTLFANVRAASGRAIITSVWGDLAYILPWGGLIFLLNLAGASALPFVGRMDFQQFMRYLSWRRRFHRRHTLLTADEVRKAWDELKAYRYPTFFFPRLEGI